MHKHISGPLAFIATLFIAISAFNISHNLLLNKSHINKAELAYTDHSPLGKQGGSVMPASCDSYPSHSTCMCTLGATRVGYNPPTPVASCNYANATSMERQTCVASGDNWIWQADPNGCSIYSCNPGFDLVPGYGCVASCTGNQVRVINSGTITMSCWGNKWKSRPSQCKGANAACDSGDCGYYSIPPAPDASHTYCCNGTETVTGGGPGCTSCPNGTVPNSNHTSCVAPSSPSVNIHF